MIREIINIDEELCNGCGLCIPGCPEGALQIIEGKARLVSDLMCDGLGACIGECPEGAIEIVKREAEAYNEEAVMKIIITHGMATTLAHLKHLKDHGETNYLNTALNFLAENQHNIPFDVVEIINKIKTTNNTKEHHMNHEHNEPGHACGCQGSKEMDFRDNNVERTANSDATLFADQPSELRQWPIQMHLVNPGAPYFQNSDLLLCADCVAFSLGMFHSGYLKEKSLAIACPKLDAHQQIYTDKLVAMIDQSRINTITVMIMEVPCCGGLLQLAVNAVQTAQRKVPVKMVRVGIKGNILEESWL